MNELEKKYNEILRAFNTTTNIDDILETQSKSHVTLDDIHDAIIFEDEKKGKVSLDYSVGYYIQSAKFIHLKSYEKNERRKKIEVPQIKNETVKYHFDNYSLNAEENQLIFEIYSGVPAYKSKISRRKRPKILESLRHKFLENAEFMD